MIKLILQIIMVGIISFICGLFQLHWSLWILSILAGVVVVHIVWEKWVFSPFDYLGVMPIRHDDPIMLAAVKSAKATRNTFISDLYPSHANDSMVKIKYLNEEDEIENIWCDVLSIEGDLITVYVRTFPMLPKEDFESTMKVNIDKIVDWSVELPNGDLRGGYTNMAMFKIYERQEGQMHPKFLRHFNRFKDEIKYDMPIRLTRTTKEI